MTIILHIRDSDDVVIDANIEVVQTVCWSSVHNSSSCVMSYVTTSDECMHRVEQRVRISRALDRKPGEMGEHNRKRRVEQGSERRNTIAHHQQILVFLCSHNHVLSVGIHRQTDI